MTATGSGDSHYAPITCQINVADHTMNHFLSQHRFHLFLLMQFENLHFCIYKTYERYIFDILLHKEKHGFRIDITLRIGNCDIIVGFFISSISTSMPIVINFFVAPFKVTTLPFGSNCFAILFSFLVLTNGQICYSIAKFSC